MDIKKALAEGKLPEASVPICLRGDLVAEFERLDRRRAELERTPNDSLAGNGLRAVAEQIEAVRAEMADYSVEFRLRAVPRRRWTALTVKHPPRDGNRSDALLGINEETFFTELLRECCAEPELDDDDWRVLLDERLTDAQWDALTTACWNLNRRGVDIPFSHAASQILRTSESG